MLVNFTPSKGNNKETENTIAVQTVNNTAPVIKIEEPEQPDEITGSKKGRFAFLKAVLQAKINKNKSYQELKEGEFITLVQGLGKDNSIKDFISIFETDYKPALPLCKIDRIEDLTDEELNNYDFMNRKPEGFEGGSFSFVYDLCKNRFSPSKEMLFTVIRSVCMLRTPSRCLFVDPQGYDYSRYILALPDYLRSMFAPEFEEIKMENRRKEEEKKREQEEKERAETHFIEECKKFLTPVNGYDPKTTKKNILSYLKHNFSGVKFTARKSTGCYCISWIDGPTPKEVANVCNVFHDHEIDYSGDYNDYKPSLFTQTFGGIEWTVDTNRKYSNEILNKTIKEVKEVHPEFTENYDSYNRVQITKESKFISHYNIVTWGSFTLSEVVEGYLNNISFYKEPEQNTAATGTDTATAGDTDSSSEPGTIATATDSSEETKNLTLIQYSAKAVAIIGDTFPIKEQLKKLGGRWNARLTCGAGWIFSRKKENELRTAFNLA